MNNKQLSNLCLAYERQECTTSGPKLEELYLDYFNNYLTPQVFCEHLGNDSPDGLVLDLVEHALSLGREYNHRKRG